MNASAVVVCVFSCAASLLRSTSFSSPHLAHDPFLLSPPRVPFSTRASASSILCVTVVLFSIVLFDRCDVADPQQPFRVPAWIAIEWLNGVTEGVDVSCAACSELCMSRRTATPFVLPVRFPFCSPSPKSSPSHAVFDGLWSRISLLPEMRHFAVAAHWIGSTERRFASGAEATWEPRATRLKETSSTPTTQMSSRTLKHAAMNRVD